MKRLIVALMAVSMVLCAVSFAMAQSASATGSIDSFQMVIPPGVTAGAISVPGVTGTFATTFQMPVNSNNPSAAGAASSFGAYYGNAAGGTSQLAAVPGYTAVQAGGAHATVAGGVF